MVLIREGNYFYGFVSAGGKKYTFDLTLSNNFQKCKGVFKVDWRLMRNLGESLNAFLKENAFRDPEEFYHKFSTFVKSTLPAPKPTESWLQHPLKTAVLVKSLQQEIGKAGEYIREVDLKSGLVKIEVTDSQFRIHKAVLKLSQNYKNEPISVVIHDLPQQRTGIESNPNLNNVFSVSEFCEKFSDLVTYFQHFWNTMSVLDAQCCVLDPPNPTFKDCFRRIKLTDTVSIALTFNPFCPGQRPKIQILGRQSDVNQFQNILQKNLENDVWDNEEDLLFNLSNVLEASIPSKIFMEEEDISDLPKAQECAICFTWKLDDKIPNEICDNPNCKSIYHLNCLFTYLSSVPRNRDYFGKIQGECPNCDDIISCTVPKLI